MYKLQNENFPSISSIKFITNNDIHLYSTRQGNNLRLPKNRTTTACNSFNSIGFKEWNSLDNDIKKSSTLSRFKRLVKQLLMNDLCKKSEQT